MSTGTSFFKANVTSDSAQVLAAAFTNAAISASGFDSVTADVNWLGTVRARLGYLITPNLLVYATGGLAYGGVSASASLTTNVNNITADSFALAYAQAIGPLSVATVSATAGTTPSATATANTAGLGPATTTAPPGSAGGFTQTGGGATAGQSIFGQIQISKSFSQAITTTSQSFAHVSDTKFGGTIGGGFEWMMAPNWSAKVEALYYDLGSVTVRTTSTYSVNPLGFINPPISTFAGSATVSNAAAITSISKASSFGSASITTSTFSDVTNYLNSG